MPKCLVYVGPYSAPTGYGRAGREYLAAITRHAPDVELIIVDSAPAGQATAGRAPADEPRFANLDRYAITDRDAVAIALARAAGGDAEVVAHGPPAYLNALAGELVGVGRATAMTTFEASIPNATERFPRLATYARVIVPSLISALPVNRWMVVVPHTTDPAFWSVPRTRPALTGPRMRFYAVGAWGPRKNLLGVLYAYLAAFTRDDAVDLSLHIPDATEAQMQYIQAAAISAAGGDAARVPHLEVSSARMPELELRAWHDAHDVYVSMARGEAWGLGLYEAALRNNLILAPDQGPHLDYTRFDGRISTTWQPCVAPPEVTLVQWRPALVATMPRGITAKDLWLEPSISVAASLMNYVYIDWKAGYRHFGGPRTLANDAAITRRLLDALDGTFDHDSPSKG